MPEDDDENRQHPEEVDHTIPIRRGFGGEPTGRGQIADLEIVPGTGSAGRVPADLRSIASAV
jgi:hypothetical protein